MGVERHNSILMPFLHLFAETITFWEYLLNTSILAFFIYNFTMSWRVILLIKIDTFLLLIFVACFIIKNLLRKIAVFRISFAVWEILWPFSLSGNFYEKNLLFLITFFLITNSSWKYFKIKSTVHIFSLNFLPIIITRACQFRKTHRFPLI